MYGGKRCDTSSFGLPTEPSPNVTSSSNQHLQVVFATGLQPPIDRSWSWEAALDIEWSHSMAPNAKIILVEARSSSTKDLMQAVDKAVSIPGVKQVSMSWGGGEYIGETTTDIHFPQNKGIVFLSSSGDTGGVVEYPSCSSNVIAVGGTSVQTDGAGNLLTETGWSGSGGGVSLYETRPGYQSFVPNVGTKRSVPDLSAIADPYTGVSVYCTTPYYTPGWQVLGGTSVACPTTAGMVNAAGSTYSSTLDQATSIYNHLGTSAFFDVTSGSAGSFSCLPGWDFVTGVGSPRGTAAF